MRLGQVKSLKGGMLCQGYGGSKGYLSARKCNSNYFLVKVKCMQLTGKKTLDKMKQIRNKMFAG